jgi:hypothetical protein
MSDDEYPLVPPGFAERYELELAGIAGSADAAFEEASEVGFPDGDGSPAVWLAQPAEDLRRSHHMVALARGEQAQAFEIEGWREEKPTNRLFAIAGYAAAGAVGTKPKRVDMATQSLVPTMGFTVPNGKLGAVTMKLEQAMRGELGGFSSLSHGQLGFHQAHAAFMAAWEAAGQPPIHVRQPQWVDPGASSGVPRPLSAALEQHTGHGASLGYWQDRDLFESDGSGKGGVAK